MHKYDVTFLGATSFGVAVAQSVGTWLGDLKVAGFPLRPKIYYVDWHLENASSHPGHCLE